MNRTELDAAVTAANAWNRFDLRTVAAPQQQGSDKTVREPADDDSGRWVVYYSERGRKSPLDACPDEDSACRALLRQLDRMMRESGRPGIPQPG